MMKILSVIIVLLSSSILGAKPLDIESGLFEFKWGQTLQQVTELAKAKYQESEVMTPTLLEGQELYEQELVIKVGDVRTAFRFMDNQLVEFSRHVYGPSRLHRFELDEEIFIADAKAQFSGPSYIKLKGVCVPELEGDRVSAIGIQITATNDALLRQLQSERRTQAMGLLDQFIEPLKRP